MPSIAWFAKLAEMARYSHLALAETVAAFIAPKSESDKVMTAVAPENDRVSAPESPASVDLAALKSATVLKGLLAITVLEVHELLQKLNRQFC